MCFLHDLFQQGCRKVRKFRKQSHVLKVCPENRNLLTPLKTSFPQKGLNQGFLGCSSEQGNLFLPPVFDCTFVGTKKRLGLCMSMYCMYYCGSGFWIDRGLVSWAATCSLRHTISKRLGLWRAFLSISAVCRTMPHLFEVESVYIRYHLTISVPSLRSCALIPWLHAIHTLYISIPTHRWRHKTLTLFQQHAVANRSLELE